MTIVEGISTQPSQQIALVLDDGTRIGLLLTYVAQQMGWFANFTGPYPGMPLNGLRLTTAPNILRQWKNTWGFGLSILRTDGSEPLSITDLADPQTTILLLNSDDVEAVEATAYPGLNP